MVLPFLNPHLLLMDVDAERLEQMDSTLRRLGYQVSKCLGFGKIFELLLVEKDSILLCVSSLQPPYGEDEFQVTRFCHKLQIPIVLTCSEWNGELLLKSVISGALDLLIKPLSDHDLHYIWKYMFWKRQDGPNLTRSLSRDSISVCSLTISKGSRTIWVPELRQKFLDAYECCLPGGISAAKIAQHMNVEGLTAKRVERYLKAHLASIKQKEFLLPPTEAPQAFTGETSNTVNTPLVLPASDDQPSNNLVNTPPPSFDAHQSSHDIIQGLQQNSLRENDDVDWMGSLVANTESSSGMHGFPLWYDDNLGGLVVGNDSLDNTLNDGSATQTDEHVHARDDPMEESERGGLV